MRHCPLSEKLITGDEKSGIGPAMAEISYMDEGRSRRQVFYAAILYAERGIHFVVYDPLEDFILHHRLTAILNETVDMHVDKFFNKAKPRKYSARCC